MSDNRVIIMYVTRRRNHPVLFALAAGTAGVAAVHGAVFVAVLMAMAAWWLLVRR